MSFRIFVIISLSKLSDSRVTLAAYYFLIYPFLSYLVSVWDSESCLPSSEESALRAIYKKFLRTFWKLLFKEKKLRTYPFTVTVIRLFSLWSQ